MSNSGKNYQRVDIEQPVKPDGYCFVDEDGSEFAVACYAPEDADGPCVKFVMDGTWKFDMWHKDLPTMIKVLQAAYDGLETK